MTDCIEWEGYKTYDGYGRYRSGALVGERAHRVAYCEAQGMHIAEIRGKVVRHKCDNPSCINPDHLELGTPADNSRDMVERGRSAKGGRHGRAKLTEKEVLNIRSRYKPRSRVDGECALAREYGVDRCTIRRAVLGLRWRHVK